MVKIKPILDKVVLKEQKSNNLTGGGIILAGGSKEQPITAEVVARGPGGVVNGKEVKMYIDEHDIVLVPKHTGVPVTIGGAEYIIVQQEDILAVIS